MSGRLPNDPLCPGTDRLQVLVPLEDGESGVPDFDRVEHGGQPGCHIRPQVRHAPRCSSLLLHLYLHLAGARALLVHSVRAYALSHFGWECERNWPKGNVVVSSRPCTLGPSRGTSSTGTDTGTGTGTLSPLLLWPPLPDHAAAAPPLCSLLMRAGFVCNASSRESLLSLTLSLSCNLRFV